ncbi:hypothetical protein KNJ79_09205 [Sphingopyxis indica]|uniref:hypothetical protein n=1 Tax=Sphingopyxis indica TaxID=436663 RepID=UPI002938E28A|nr:hypothetical protein [Sphingopyxis indica]WOF45027.1 hypothetical protein KNJ79_09205 [Sphingopyxis indica]
MIVLGSHEGGTPSLWFRTERLRAPETSHSSFADRHVIDRIAYRFIHQPVIASSK